MYAPPEVQDVDRLAVVSATDRLTYGELGSRVGGIVSHLRKQSVEPGDLVAVWSDRSASTVAAIMGVLAAGCAYTVIDGSGQPREVIRRQLAHARPAHLLAAGRGAWAGFGRSFSVTHLADIGPERSEIPPAPPDPESTAYVVYTSGSSGRPKAVMISHANLRHYCRSMTDLLGLQPGLTYAHVSTLSADLGNTGLFLSLLTGGTLHLVDDDLRRDASRLFAYLTHHDVQFLKITPSHWRALLDGVAATGQAGPRLRYLVLGGETLTRSLASETLRRGLAERLFNHYGPTETTIGVMVHEFSDGVTPAGGSTDSVPIGRPIGTTAVNVRDASGAYFTHGATGELHVAGPSVAKGYLHDPDLTSERFVSPRDDGVIYYRTGDRVRLDETGLGVFLGRVDRQTKVSGFMVDLEDLERVLRQVDGVKDAHVFMYSHVGRQVLGAVVVPTSRGKSALSGPVLREALRKVVPTYMVPSSVLVTDSLPITANGKVDGARIAELLQASLGAASAGGSSGTMSTRFRQDAIQAWNRHLPHPVSSVDENFFDLGGDSIGVIQVIAELQRQGHPVTAGSFLKSPTIRETEAAMMSRDHDAGETAPDASLLAPSQRWFFEQGLAQPDHWNQSILLSSRWPLEVEMVKRAVRELVTLHPLLSTGFSFEAERWRPAYGCRQPVVTSSGAQEEDREEAADHIFAISGTVNQEIRLTDGPVLRVHVFELPGVGDQLLLVAHHLVVDAVSWMTIVNDIVELYDSYVGGHEVHIPAESCDIWRWTDHLQANRTVLESRSSYWEEQLAGPADLVGHSPGDNTEGSAKSLWMTFEQSVGDRLGSVPGLSRSTAVSASLFGAFAHALGSSTGIRELRFDFESHGRLCLSESMDVSRSVGWFTSTFPLHLSVDPDSLEGTVTRSARLFAGVPDLGLGHELSRHYRRVGAGRTAPGVLYNFLGDATFQRGTSIDLSPSSFEIASSRGPANDRVHELKLTARTVRAAIVADISYAEPRFSRDRIRELGRRMQANVRVLAGDGALRHGPSALVVEEHSSSGQLCHVPSKLGVTAVPTRHELRTVLLTGATGYLGVYLLKGILERTDAEVICVLRRTDLDGWQRLMARYDWYFGTGALRHHHRRVTVVDGDITRPRIALGLTDFEALGKRIDAIYHLAADTRLIGPATPSLTTNVQGVEHILQLAQIGTTCQLHHMSTLAVCGVNEAKRPVVFSEASYDIGQRFQNHYEESKFRAEGLIRRYVEEGGDARVYRVGNVSGDSRTGGFQINARDNRFVQFLAAVVRLGRLPRDLDEQVVLAPVDRVVDGVLALSLQEVPGRVFHVDEPTAFTLAEVFEALRGLGIPLAPVDAPDFTALFRGDRSVAADGTPGSDDVSWQAQLSVGQVWASREDRNVRFDHGRTARVLAALGHAPPPLDRRWLSAFLGRLVDVGVLQTGAGHDLEGGHGEGPGWIGAIAPARPVAPTAGSFGHG